MTHSIFESLFEIETDIRSYISDIDELENYFEDKSPEENLVLKLELREPIGERDKSPDGILRKLEIWGAGSPDPTDKEKYGMNARIMQAAVKAMISEMKAVTQELIDERDTILFKHPKN